MIDASWKDHPFSSPKFISMNDLTFCVTAELMWNDDTTTANNVPASSSSSETAAALDSSTIFAIADIEINVDVSSSF